MSVFVPPAYWSIGLQNEKYTGSVGFPLPPPYHPTLPTAVVFLSAIGPPPGWIGWARWWTQLTLPPPPLPLPLNFVPGYITCPVTGGHPSLQRWFTCPPNYLVDWSISAVASPLILLHSSPIVVIQSKRVRCSMGIRILAKHFNKTKIV